VLKGEQLGLKLIVEAICERRVDVLGLMISNSMQAGQADRPSEVGSRLLISLQSGGIPANQSRESEYRPQLSLLRVMQILVQG
jgi:hypothetical protein